MARKTQPGKVPDAIRDETALEGAITALRACEPRLFGRLLNVCGTIPLRPRPADFNGLAWIIISQQVSTASADAIHARFSARFPGAEPAAILAASDGELRLCGLSGPKIRTLQALAKALAEGRLDLSALSALPAQQAHAALTAVHGIGPWTADLFLLFCLGHPDAWPAGDLALQEALRLALRLAERPSAREIEARAERWRPWRGVAARVLWAWYRHAREHERATSRA